MRVNAGALSLLMILEISLPSVAQEFEKQPVQPLLEEFDLNYPEDGTSGNPKYRMFGKDFEEAEKSRQKLEAYETMRQEKFELLADLKDETKAARSSVGTLWAFALACMIGTFTVVGVTQKVGWWEWDSVLDEYRIKSWPPGVIGGLGTGVLVFTILGAVSTRRYLEKKRRLDALIKEIGDPDSGLESPELEQAW